MKKNFCISLFLILTMTAFSQSLLLMNTSVMKDTNFVGTPIVLQTKTGQIQLMQ